MHALLDPAVLAQSAAMFAKHARGVGLIDQQHGPMPRRQFGNSRQRGQIAGHRKQRIGDDQLSPATGRKQQILQIRPVSRWA